MITINIDTKPRDLRKMVEKLGRTFTKNHKRAMRRAAAEGVNRINKRTSLGLDVKEQPFRPYSKAYKAFRENRTPALPTNKVRLIFTGQMRKSLQYGLRGQDGLIFSTAKRSPGRRRRTIERVHSLDLTSQIAALYVTFILRGLRYER